MRTKKREATGEQGFKTRLTAPSFVGQVSKVVLDKEIELPFELYHFHEDIAREMNCSDFSEYISFCMKEVARYWLEVDHERFGQLMAQEKIRGHCIQNTCLDDED